MKGEGEMIRVVKGQIAGEGGACAAISSDLAIGQQEIGGEEEAEGYHDEHMHIVAFGSLPLSLSLSVALTRAMHAHRLIPFQTSLTFIHTKRSASSHLIVSHDPVPDGLYSHKPGGQGSLDERSVGPPAKWVRVVDGGIVDQPSHLLDLCNNLLVRLLDMKTLEIRHL